MNIISVKRKKLNPLVTTRGTSSVTTNHQGKLLNVVNSLRLFGSTTRVTRVSLTDMRNINNPALQAERFVLLSDKSNLFYQGHTGLRLRTVRCQ